jgi:hypothetical protein
VLLFTKTIQFLALVSAVKLMTSESPALAKATYAPTELGEKPYIIHVSVFGTGYCLLFYPTIIFFKFVITLTIKFIKNI